MKLLALIVLTLLAFVASVLSFVPGGGVVRTAARSNFNPPTAAASFPSGSAHYYKLEEASGTRSDSVAADHLAEIIGTVGQTTGKSGNAANWVPSTGRLNDSLSDAPFLTQASCSFWVNVDNLPASADNLITAGAGDNDVQVKITSGGNVVLYNNATGDIISSALGALDTWHLVIFTLNGSAWQLSIDGGTYSAGTGDAPDEGAGLNIGTETTLDAAIDEVAIFKNRILTQQEVSDIWNGGTGLFGP